MSRSIIHDKKSRVCYLCVMLYGDCTERSYLEEHHIFGGPDRKKSEHYGLKVYLCPEHHRTTREAVHICREYDLMLKRTAQREFERRYGHEQFMKEFRRNWLDA